MHLQLVVRQSNGVNNMRHSTFIATLQIVFIVMVASAEDRRTVSVSGHGEIEVEPDIATVEMGIFVFDRDLLNAK